MFRWLVLVFAVVHCSALQIQQQIPAFENGFVGDDDKLSELSEKIAIDFVEEYVRYRKTGVESQYLQKLSKQLATMHSGGAELLITQVAELDAADQFFVCTTCRATVNVIARMFQDPEGELNGPNRKEDSRNVLLDLCRRFDYQNDAVCGGMFDNNYQVLDFILQNTIIDSRSMCSMLPISFCKVKQPEFGFILDIDKNDPNEDSPKMEPPKKSDDDLTILHLTDIHHDPLYKPGALADCGLPLCCQDENTEGDSKAAGYWSDYRTCDSPWHMITDAFDHIKRTHTKIDMIYHTGDLVDHMVWGTSKEKNMKVLTDINELLAKEFPDIAVYSSVGNHEPHPLNVFGPPDVPENIAIRWMYAHLYKLWSKWLPADTENTILDGGYYTVAPKPGFRIISLNNNDCYIYNFWIFYNGSSVLPQLTWLHDTLLAAERAGEQVHILAHIPSGDSDCWSVWGREFNRIVARFKHTISGIFTGHTHIDELNVHYTEKGHAVAVSWNGGSLTSYTRKNPNYKIFQVSSKTKEVVDYETWIFDLEEANKYGAERRPIWFKEYEFTKEFAEDLSPAGMDKWLEKMADNPKLLRNYWRLKHTNAEPRIGNGCDKKCLNQTICRLATTVYDQKKRCQQLQERLAIALENEAPEPEPDPEDDGAASLLALPKWIFACLALLLT